MLNRLREWLRDRLADWRREERISYHDRQFWYYLSRGRTRHADYHRRRRNDEIAARSPAQLARLRRAPA